MEDKTMKKIHNFLMGLAFLATTASCTLNKLEEPVAPDRDGKATEVTFTAMAPGNDGTKTMVSETGPEILWQDADEILIFFGTDKYEFITTLENPASQAEFRGTISGFTALTEGSSGPAHTFWAVYPFNWRNERNGESVTVMVPSRQTAVAGSFDPAALVSVACSNNLMLGFYNVCGGLKFKLSKEGIQQVEFRANGDKPLAGNATVKMDDDGFPLVTEVQNQETSILLTAPYGETFEPGTWYYLTCLPGALEQGWTLTFRSETETGILEHPAPAEVKRSVWGVLENPETAAAFHPEDNIIWNEIRYTTTDGSTITPANVYWFNEEGNAILSNTYENGVGRMVFEKPITCIPEGAFRSIRTLQTLQLPRTVRELGYRSIAYDYALTELHLPEGLRTIGGQALIYDSALERLYVPGSVETVERNAFAMCQSLEAFEGPLASADGHCLIIDKVLWGFAQAEVTDYTLPEGLEAIGGNVFYNNVTIRTIVIPEGVRQVYIQAFHNCSSLESVVLPNSLLYIGAHAFRYTKLSEVVVPEGVTEIGDFAFSYCNNLTTVSLPSTLETVGESIFCSDSALASFQGQFVGSNHQVLVVDGEIKAVAPAGLVDGALTIPGTAQSIGRNALYGLSGLKKVIIEDGVNTIGDYAFQNCPDLEEVSIPASVNAFGSYIFTRNPKLQAFKGPFASEDGRCLVLGGYLHSFAPAGLTEYTIPEGVTEIGLCAFEGCGNLAKVTFASTVEKVGNSAFEGCAALSNVTLNEGLQEIAPWAFGSCCVYDGNTAISGLRNIEIPSTVTSIGEYAFYNSGYLSTITLKEGLQTIGSYAFDDTRLYEIKIPASVTMIGDMALACTNLRKLIFRGATPPTLEGELVYENQMSEGFIRVPAAALDTYKTAWPDYVDYIANADIDEQAGGLEGVGVEDWN